MNHLEESSGYLAIGLHQEAWDALEQLPPEDRALPPVLAMRVRIYLAMNRQEEARIVANGMIHRHQIDGQSWLSLARVLAVSGKPREDIKGALKMAFQLEKDLRLEALEDPLLDGFWQSE